MEVISDQEAEIVLKYLIAGLAPDKAVSEIIEQRKFYSPAGVRRDVERIRVGEVERQKKLVEGFNRR